MPKGKSHAIESSEFCDPGTGVEIVQLTGNPTTSTSFYFENMQFTADSNTVVFSSRRTADRDAPSDLYRCDVDGRNLIQLTDCDDFGGMACLSLDGKKAYYPGRKELRSVDLTDYTEEVVAGFDYGVGNPSVGGDYVFGRTGGPDGTSAVVRCPIDGGPPETIREGKTIGHLNASRTGNWVAWIETSEINEYGAQTWYVMRADGTDNRRWAVQNWAHSSWLGLTDRMQGTLLPPGHGLNHIAPDETEPTTIVAAGPYFWHSGASLDGEWLVTDTNWPDVGLQLVHVPTGRFGTLCLSLSANGSHPTHPHPSFSPDGRKVLYNSTRTGICQIYVAHVSDDLIEEVRGGDLYKRSRVGPRML